MKRVRAGAVLVFLLALARAADACTCAAPYPDGATDAQVARSVSDELDRSIAVFMGRVAVRDSLTVTFEVDAVWKGEIGSSYEMSSGAAANPDGTITVSSCDFSFARGRSYLVFAFGKSLPTAKASSCTHTSELRYALDTLPYLDKLAERRRPR